MRRTQVLDETAMQSAESQIPQLASQAGRAAHLRAVNNHAATLVMKSAAGQLVARQAGGSVVVLKNLPASTPVEVGAVFKRATKPGRAKAGGP